MEQLHSTQFVHHEILYEDRQRALRGCDDRTYAFLCRRGLEEGPRRGRARMLDRLAKVLSIVRRRNQPDQMHETPERPAGDPVEVLGQDDPVVCIDLGNPLVGASTPTPSPASRSGDGGAVRHGKD